MCEKKRGLDHIPILWVINGTLNMKGHLFKHVNNDEVINLYRFPLS